MISLKKETGKSTTAPEIFFSPWWEKWGSCRRFSNGKARFRKGCPIGKRRRRFTSGKNFPTFCSTSYASPTCVGSISTKLRYERSSSTPSSTRCISAKALRTSTAMAAATPLMEEIEHLPIYFVEGDKCSSLFPLGADLESLGGII